MPASNASALHGDMRLVVRNGGVEIDLADPALRLTPEQQAACATDREIVLTAGAGAGKTHALSVRYAALQLRLALAGQADIASVLVLTFTERAAAEMAERCEDRLFELAAAARAARDEIDVLRAGAGPSLVEALEVLTSEVDRSAITTFHGFCRSVVEDGAVVLSEIEARRLAERQIDEALDRMVASYPSDLSPLLDAFETRAALVEAARVALERRATLGPVLEAHARGAITIGSLMATASTSADEAAAWTREIGVPTITTLARLAAPSRPLVTDDLRPLLATARDEPREPLAIWGRYREVLESLITDAGTFRALDHHLILGKRSDWPDESRFRLAKEAARRLGEQRRSDWTVRAQAARRLPATADRVLLETLAPFARLVLDAATGLVAELERMRATTFEDMQSRAIAAVISDATVRATLRRRHRYIMVDELQDTDAAQWSLVRSLARDRAEVAEDRLFVVGDPKQAIYSFRGGDVRVFRRATEELAARPLSLATNFRSQKGIVDFCNALFPHVFGGGPASPWEVPYAPMVAASAEPGGEVVLLHGDELSPDRQAVAVADWIATALQDPAWSDRGRFPTAPIAVLLRARTHQASFETALRRRGVPFTVARGLSFWARREVIDVVLSLSTVARGDPIATVGYLRSPLGGLTDQEVLDCGGKLEGEAAARIATWRTLAREAPASEVVHAIASASRPYLAVSDPSGQAEANVRRLVHLAASLDPLGIDAVADRLLAEVDRGSRESEAIVTPGEPRVVLCTVHGAKGLEFPVVIVPQLDARPRLESGPLRVARLAGDDDWAIATRVSDPDADVQTRVAPGRLAAIDDVLRQEADAEERRLFYVAATRAQEKLVLVGSDQPPAEPGARRTWMQLVMAHLPPTTTVLPVPAPAPTPVADASRAGSGQRAAGSRRQPSQAPAPVAIAASTLDLFAASPDGWFRTVVLGLAEETSPARRRWLALQAARGRAVHRALERGLTESDEAIALHWTALARAAGATRDEAADGLSRVLEHVARGRASPMARTILEAPGLVELPFRVSHRHITLHGRIDRLWQSADGPVVVDWKTERAPEGLDPSTHRLQLLAYCWAADRILTEGGAGRVRSGVLFFTAEGAGVRIDFGEDDLESFPIVLERAAAVAIGDQGTAGAETGTGSGAGGSVDSAAVETQP